MLLPLQGGSWRFTETRIRIELQNVAVFLGSVPVSLMAIFGEAVDRDDVAIHRRVGQPSSIAPEFEGRVAAQAAA